LTNICTGVMTQLMQLSNIKIINKIIESKSCFNKNRYIYEPCSLLGCYFSWNFYHI